MSIDPTRIEGPGSQTTQVFMPYVPYYAPPCKACGGSVSGRICTTCGADQAVLLGLIDARMAIAHAQAEKARADRASAEVPAKVIRVFGIILGVLGCIVFAWIAVLSYYAVWAIGQPQ